MRSVRLLATFVAFAVVVASCGDDGSAPTSTSETTTPPPGPSVSFLQADLDRAASTDVTADELTQLIAGDRSFAFAVFREGAGDTNFMISPYSIAVALTMAMAGAEATTAEQMQAALHLQLIAERVHAARNELDLRITAEPPPAPPDDEREPFAIRTANSIWGQQGYPFFDAFLELLARDYGAGLNLADFASDPESARIEINDWVEDRTEGRIEDLIPPGAIDSLTRLVLVNAIWFKASWAEQFEPELTEEAAFTLLDGTQVDVPMMYAPGLSVATAAGDGYRAVRLPYAGDASMLLILPDEGRFTEVVGSFDEVELEQLTAAMGGPDVNLWLPRFEFKTELGLNPVLQALGMVDAFDPSRADFSGITGAPNDLYVSDVIHQSFIKVDEEGTEAAAATAVIIRATSAPIDEPIDVRFDRPFLFLIQHGSTGEILFIGQVTNPSG